MSSTFAESFVVAPLFLEAYSQSETKFLDGGTIRHIKACFHNVTRRDPTPPRNGTCPPPSRYIGKERGHT